MRIYNTLLEAIYVIDIHKQTEMHLKLASLLIAIVAIGGASAFWNFGSIDVTSLFGELKDGVGK